MKYRSKLPFLTLIFGFLLFISAGCLPDNDPGDRAYISLRVQFTDSGTMDPVNGTRINIFAEYESSSSPLYQGWEETDEDGVIEGFLDNPLEIILTRLTFVTMIDEEEYVVEREVNIRFSYDEPFEVIDIEVEFPITETEEEEEE